MAPAAHMHRGGLPRPQRMAGGTGGRVAERRRAACRPAAGRPSRAARRSLARSARPGPPARHRPPRPGSAPGAGVASTFAAGQHAARRVEVLQRRGPVVGRRGGPGVEERGDPTPNPRSGCGCWSGRPAGPGRPYSVSTSTATPTRPASSLDAHGSSFAASSGTPASASAGEVSAPSVEAFSTGSSGTFVAWSPGPS